MKALKLFAVVTVGLVVLFAVALILALTPAVQTWAARKALAGQPGTSVGHVNAGFSAAEIKNLRWVGDGAVVSVDRLVADYSLWDYLTQNRINANDVTAQGIVIDLRHSGAVAGPSEPDETTPEEPRATPAKESPARPRDDSRDFEGILRQPLPFDVRVVRLAAEGRALLPGAKVVAFNVNGRGIESGQRGTVEWKAELNDPNPQAPLHAVRSQGALGIQLSTERKIQRVDLEGVIAAEGPQIPPEQIKFEARAAQTDVGARETYSASVALVRDAQAERLLQAEGELAPSSREIVGQWNLAVRTQQLAALLSGLGLPEIAATGAGTFGVNPVTSAASAKGELQATISRLEKVSPELASFGSLQMRASFDGAFADGKARLDQLELRASGPRGDPIADLTTAQRVEFDTASQRITFANPQAELARLAVRGLPFAWAQPFVGDLTIASGELSLVLAVEAEPDGSRIRAHAVEPLAVRNVTLRRGDQALVEQMTLTAQPRIDYAANQISAELSRLSVSTSAGDGLQGNVSATATHLESNPRIAFASQLEANIVSALKTYLPIDPGPLHVAVSVDGRLEDDVLHVAKLSTVINRDGGALVAAVDLQQPMTANVAAQTFSLPRPDSPAARIRLGEIPLAWAQAFVPDSQLSGAITGGSFDVSVAASDRIAIDTIEPFVAQTIGVTLEGEPAIRGLDVAAELRASKQGDAIDYDVRRLEITEGDRPIARAAVAGQANVGENPSFTAKGNVEADAGALMRQPALAPFASLSRGQVTSTFDVNLADAIEAKARLSAKDMIARQNNQPLGDLDLTLTALLRDNGTGTVVAPLTLVNGQRRSDLSVNAAFDNSGEALLLTARVSSDQFFVDDFRPFTALAPSESPSENRPAPAPRPSTVPVQTPPPAPKRDTEPFWAGARGKVEVDMKRVIYGRDYPITGVHGTATIAENRIALDGLEGRLKEKPFQANAAITFAADQAQPYALTGIAHVSNFDLGELLRAANPNERPAIESNVSVDARFNGSGATFGDLAKRVYGHFDITGTEGVLRALGNKTNLANLGAAAIGLVGALTGSNTTAALGEIAAAFAELEFDTFRLQVDRGADLSFKLSNIEFISPLMRTTGTGQVINREGASLDAQPMQVLLQLGAKGALAQLLNKHGLLGSQTDEKGYYLLERKFNIGGTPANPDASAFWKQLAAELVRKQGVPALQNLFGR